MESALPYLMYKWRKKQIKKKMSTNSGGSSSGKGIEPLHPQEEIDEATDLQSQIESSKDFYEVGTYFLEHYSLFNMK